MLEQISPIVFDVFYNKLPNISTFSNEHITTFNNFLENGLEVIVEKLNPIVVQLKLADESQVRVEVNFRGIFIESPQKIETSTKKKIRIYPNECRQFSLSYMLSLYSHYTMEIKSSIDEVERIFVKSDEPMLLGKIPCMVRSKWCNLYGLSESQISKLKEDRIGNGGYFIVNGIEQQIVNSENKVENYIFKTYDKNRSEYSAWIPSKKPNRYEYPYYTTITIDKYNNIFISVSISKKKKIKIPMVIFMRGLGCITDLELWELITNVGADASIDANIEDLLRQAFTYSDKTTDLNSIKTVMEALLYIGKKFRASDYHKHLGENISEDDILKRFSNKLLDVELLPHLGNINRLEKKKVFLAYMIRSAIDLKLGYTEVQDTENYGNKRITTSGIAYGQLFRHTMRSVMQQKLKSKIAKSLKEFRPGMTYDDLIERIHDVGSLNAMVGHIAKGEWPAGGTNSVGHNVKMGMTQNVGRKSLKNTIMNTQLIKTLTKQVKGSEEQVSSDRRKLHQTQWGYLDGYDTPESIKVGLVKNKTFISYITYFVDATHIYDILAANPLVKLLIPNMYNINNMTKIMINGDLEYVTTREDTKVLYGELIAKRRAGEINRYTSIVVKYSTFEILIYTDAGRFIRPVYIIDAGNKLRMDIKIASGLKSGLFNWDWLILNGIVEYISIHESYNSLLIAFNENDLKNRMKSYTHCEISSKVLSDINMLSIPFANFNPGPRNTFGCSMAQQAAGVFATNIDSRMDTEAFYACAPQRALVTTLGDRYTRCTEFPTTVNINIAITSAMGYNIEDALVVSKGYIDRGGSTVFAIRTIQVKLQGNGEEFKKPDKLKTRFYKDSHSYDALGKDGAPIVGKMVHRGDVLIGKVKRFKRSERKKSANDILAWEDNSKLYDIVDPGLVTNVIVMEEVGGWRIMKVKLLIFRSIQIGDKFASASAQKATVAMIWKEEDMPYTEGGVRIELIFNTHGIIKRMTIAHLAITAAGIIATKKMGFVDGTIFNGLNIKKDLVDRLAEMGHDGDTVMYDGQTGRRIMGKIFVGPCVYRRLKHMVNDKMYGRSEGFMNPKTRQPGSGRKRHGGLRIGYMERDALIAHGVCQIMKEIYVNHSDEMAYYISEATKFICMGN